MSKNFAITGVAGFVAPRHLRAIKETGNRLLAAVDPHDAAEILDQFSFDVRFFTEIDFTEGFVDLHRRVYEEVLAGRGFGIEDAKPSIELVHRIRNASVVAPGADAHPYVAPKSISAARF
jgi:hypothetical protein